MSFFTYIKSEQFGEPWQDGSISILRTEESGSILVAQYDYSSDIVPVFRCANTETVQYFVHRFARAIDSWHDIFTVGPIAKFTLNHRPADGDGDSAAALTSEIDLSFAGWLVYNDDETLHPDLDSASAVLNAPPVGAVIADN